MKRILLYIVIIGSLWFAPVEASDVGNLAPVEVILLDAADEKIIVSTDTNDMGEGATVKKALENMTRRSLRYIYLDTARYLLVTESAADRIQEITPFLDPGVQICAAPDNTDLNLAAQYLRTHMP